MKKPLCIDNRGLTLVELIVGVTILAIIVVPLLHVFVTGAATEVKSRKYGDATQAAQNLIEQVQAADADLILSNSGAAEPGALFYTSSHLSDGLNGSTSAPLPDANGNYYIGIKNCSYDGSSFNALITLCASTSEDANTTPVVVGNKMDVLLNMTKADSKAEDKLKAECGDLVANISELNIGKLTRSITLNVTKTIDSTTDTYKVEAVFSYSGMIPYTVVINKTTYHYNYIFSYSEQSSASVGNIVDSAQGNPIFSVFLFYNAFYKASGLPNETVLINNGTLPDINFFIVNTNQIAAPSGYEARIWYKYQKFNDNGTPKNSLVFTNLNTALDTDNAKYYAFTNALFRKTMPVSGYLVETKQLNRKFNVNVKLFESGLNFSGTPIVSIDSAKLNY